MSLRADGRKGRPVKRNALVTVSVLGFLSLAAISLPASAAIHTSSSARSGRAALADYDQKPYCSSGKSTCADIWRHAPGHYVGHDEPSVLFKSKIPGSGNNMAYTMTLPRDPKAQPNTTGKGGTTWSFQLRPTFWFGLALCDTESAPEFTKTCKPDSDSNNLVGKNPKAANYIGKHPGTAFMELQFDGPGYVPQFTGFGCAAKVYCAVLTIDSFMQNQNNGVFNTAACNQFQLGGPEPVNWAWVTKSGKSQAPANPLFSGTVTHPVNTAVNPNLKKDLLMNPGDRIHVHMHDTPAGFQVNLTDLTTGKSGSMTASVANGFGHILYTPHSKTCKEAPYAFHPAYSTASPRGNVWTAHTYNVAMSDEVGHFENCLKVNSSFDCTKGGSEDPKPDGDDQLCFPASFSSLVKIAGCEIFPDQDYDGQTYRPDWPGTFKNVALDQKLHPSSETFTSPLTNGKNYSTTEFETDLPAIEVKGAQFNPPFCNPSTGAHCVNPPMGAQFYPFYSTTVSHGACLWREGGRFMPHTVNDFGGSSKTEFGHLLFTLFPNSNGKPVVETNNFNSGAIKNPCRA
jgi:hypothetical protein